MDQTDVCFQFFSIYRFYFFHFNISDPFSFWAHLLSVMWVTSSKWFPQISILKHSFSLTFSFISHLSHFYRSLSRSSHPHTHTYTHARTHARTHISILSPSLHFFFKVHHHFFSISLFIVTNDLFSSQFFPSLRAWIALDGHISERRYFSNKINNPPIFN